MSITSVNGELLMKMVSNGAINLKNDFEEINQLNVFPVPDGDTGTNMSMTMSSGVAEMNNCKSSSIVDMAKSLSRGLLMGARGNSGVILSQFFRGLYVGMKNLEGNELLVDDFIKCLVSGKEVAYKAVMDPVEGTILTVIREAAEAVLNHHTEIKDFETLFKIYLDAANLAETKTPDLLPVLKEAGVKDSGGAGFIKVIEGMLLALEGKMLSALDEEKKAKSLKYLYSVDTTVLLKNANDFVDSDLRQPLSFIGDSLELVKNNSTVRVKIHTNVPGEVLNLVQKNGDLVKVTVENLNPEMASVEEPTAEKELAEQAIVAVCFGEGIKDTFKELGVDYIIDGGQTMNPPTEEFVKAIKEVHAKNVIIIPNNGNVILSAEQSIKICDDVNVKVLRAKTIAQGYASLMVYDPSASLDDNFNEMTEAINNVSSGEVTYAVRDTSINGVDIHAGDYMGILNGDIVVSVKERIDATKELIKQAVNEDSAILTLFVGANVEESEAKEIEEFTLELNDGIEVEIVSGKQDIYSYIICVE